MIIPHYYYDYTVLLLLLFTLVIPIGIKRFFLSQDRLNKSFNVSKYQVGREKFSYFKVGHIIIKFGKCCSNIYKLINIIAGYKLESKYINLV